VLAQLRADAPVFSMTVHVPERRSAWLITRYDDVAAALKDTRLAKDPRAATAAGPEPWMPGFLKPLQRNMLDLDPPEGGFDVAVEVAGVAREVLAGVGLEAVAKTSGAKGMHVYVPLRRRHDFGPVRAAGFRIAQLIEERIPDIATTEFAKAGRGGRLFLDAGRNAPGAHTVAVYSPRARPGASVSFPFPWDDLAKVRPENFTIRTVPKILEREGDRWAKLSPAPQTLSRDLLRD